RGRPPRRCGLRDRFGHREGCRCPDAAGAGNARPGLAGVTNRATPGTATAVLLRHIGRLTTGAAPVITDAAVIVRDGRIAWTGADVDLPLGLEELPELDAAGAAVIPGFVDAPTPAVWAGDRGGELTARIAGEGYAAGGIRSTVAATRAASE